MNANEKQFCEAVARKYLEPTPRTTMVKVLWLPGFITLPPDDSYTELANWATLLGLADIVDQAVPGNDA